MRGLLLAWRTAYVTWFLAVHSQLCPLRIFFSFGPDGLGPGKNEVPPDWPQEPTFFVAQVMKRALRRLVLFQVVIYKPRFVSCPKAASWWVCYGKGFI